MPAERTRLAQANRREAHWRRWGPYLSERQWGTVREDYTANGDAWGAFPFEHSHQRTYRWGEDGLLGISDNHQRLCFGLALWNGVDPILKERLFGLTNGQGNHGEDVKEIYYYLDATPTSSYLKGLYKYPQRAFPYRWLIDENARRGLKALEAELWDSGVMAGHRYFDVFVEYAKADVNDLHIRITVANRGSRAAGLHVLPSVWFRNRWSWGRKNRPKPLMSRASAQVVKLEERQLGEWQFQADGADDLWFTENETNTENLYGYPSGTRHYKDAFHRRLIHSALDATNPEEKGTKACAVYELNLAPGESRVLTLRLAPLNAAASDAPTVFAARVAEADEFYCELGCALSDDARNVQRQAFAGLLWSKQYYHYVVEDWLKGDPAGPAPPATRLDGRNSSWVHLFNEDIISMPDKWEYPWYAAWDSAFHMVPMALIDPGFAKAQLGLFLREWYLHPNGQLPAYEWTFDDVNPPVHAWACWRVFKVDGKRCGKPDYEWLESVYHKLLMNFTWWVNRKDSLGDNIFEGGFLGLDNIGVFDRGRPLPTGGRLEQSDGTSWMAMYSLNMLRIALELAQVRPAYEDIASKFFEHFLYISSAMNKLGGTGLWDEGDGFYYDRLRFSNGKSYPMRVRSLVGLIPLIAVEPLDLSRFPRKMEGFRRRTAWFIEHRPDLCQNLEIMTTHQDRSLLALVSRDRLVRILATMLSEAEFLSPYGIRSLSRHHLRAPYLLRVNGEEYSVEYEPAESSQRMFGGNSNWRGPVWLPVNYLLIEALQKFHYFYGDSLQVEFPTGSGRFMNLAQVAAELSRRLSHLFLRDENGRRPCFGDIEMFQSDPHFRDYVWFHEYFHGDVGAGLGANHQTGWTALVAKLLEQSGE